MISINLKRISVTREVFRTSGLHASLCKLVWPSRYMNELSIIKIYTFCGTWTSRVLFACLGSCSKFRKGLASFMLEVDLILDSNIIYSSETIGRQTYYLLFVYILGVAGFISYCFCVNSSTCLQTHRSNITIVHFT